MSTEAWKRLSAAEYLERERAAETKSEFYDGEVFAMAGGSEAHSLIAENLNHRLRNALEDRPCRVYNSDLRVATPRGLYTYPDVTVVRGSSELLDDHRDTLLNPLVIFEVFSLATEAYDRGKKFEQYRTLASLKAYVLVSQDHKSIEAFTRQPNGSWVLTAAQEGTLSIPALDVALSVEEVYANVEFPPEEPPTATPA